MKQRFPQDIDQTLPVTEGMRRATLIPMWKRGEPGAGKNGWSRDCPADGAGAAKSAPSERPWKPRLRRRPRKRPVPINGLGRHIYFRLAKPWRIVVLLSLRATC